MQARRIAAARGTLDRWTDFAAFALTVLLPLALLHARAAAEILIGAIDTLFLLHVWAGRDSAWLRSAFAATAGLWWGWLVLCSAVGTGGFWLALVAVRLPLLAVALGHWVLRHERRRYWMWLAIAAAATWIALQCWEQLLTGSNLFGQGRWGDGALTGPFRKPRAGPALVLILFPVLAPFAARRDAAGRVGFLVLAGFGLATMLLIAQRMPSLLALLGFVLLGVLVPRLRLWLAGVVGAAAGLLAAMPWLAPVAYDKLVTHTRDQLADFRHSAYGEIFARAMAAVRAHPWLGQGMDAFRRFCAHASASDLSCNIHPHNYYLEAAVNGGVPLLVLFAAMAMSALFPVCRERRAIGVCIAGGLAFWPIATTSAFTSMPNAGWIFSLIGMGLATCCAVSGHFLRREYKPGL